MFNLKNAQKAVTTTEKMLIDNNKDLGLKPNEDDGTYNALLEDNREQPVGDKILEKALDGKALDRDARVGKAEDKAILEGALNSVKDTMNKLRDESTNVPLMDFSRESEWALSEEYKKAVKVEGGDTSFWDKYVGDQLPADQITKITDNVQPSQLVENYETREAFTKENPSIGKDGPGAEENIMGEDLEPEKTVVYENKKASVGDLMRDADAMLYHIYRTASEESRELTKIEQQMIVDINSAKIRVLSQAKSEDQLGQDEWDELMREEQMLMQADDFEDQSRVQQEIDGIGDTQFEQKREDGIDAEQDLEWDGWETQEEADADRMRREEEEISRGDVDPLTGEIGPHPDTPALNPPWFEQR